MSQPLIDALEFLKPITGHSPYIFQRPRGKGTEHIALETPNHLIKRMGYQGKFVSHGVRHMALTYGQDILKTPFHVIDLQMGHNHLERSVRRMTKHSSWMKGLNL